MGDHYHHTSDVQGVADEQHRHSPRDIGAAEDHDLEMLRRDVQHLEQRADRLEAARARDVLRTDSLERSLNEAMLNTERLSEFVLTISKHLTEGGGV